MDKSRVELSVLIQHFEVHNRTEGKSPRTVQWYNDVLGMFLDWLQERGAPTTLDSIREMEVRGRVRNR
jgi:phosphoglycerol transferase MdoB-like AlkP superfamily enzyme